MNVLRRLFSTRYMLKDGQKRGEITSSREAYGTSLHMALPAVAEMVFIALIGMADTAMVGRLGPYAVAAVGLTGQPRMIFMAIFFALNVGVTAIVSRRKGEGDQDSARLCLRQAIIIEIFLGILLSVLAVVMSGWMMKMAGANEDTLIASTQYFQIVGAGLIFSALSMTICAAQRGVGNTRITMTVSISANVVNVVFNYLLINGHFGFPRLEVRGAAIATVMGNAVGFILALMSVTKKDAYLRISLKDKWRPDKPMMKNIARVGGNSIVEQIAMRVGFFTYAKIVAGLGTNSFAAHQIAMQLMNLSFTFADGIAAATTSLVGQNLGKKRPDLSIMYGKIGQRFALLVAIGLCATSISVRFFFPSLFTTDQSIIEITANIIIILAFIQPMQTSQIVMAGSLRGAGDTKFVAITMILTVAIIRPLTSMLFVNVFGWGLQGAWYAIMFDQVIRLVLLFNRFSKGKWVHISL